MYGFEPRAPVLALLNVEVLQGDDGASAVSQVLAQLRDHGCRVPSWLKPEHGISAPGQDWITGGYVTHVVPVVAE